MEARRRVTLILPYYRNPGMLTAQLDHMRAWGPGLLGCWDLIVVDDGSPDQIARITSNPGFGSLRLFRCGVDVRWNWLFCRNLGAEKARTDWILMTDIDHLVPERTAQAVLSHELEAGRAFRFQRVSAPEMHSYKPHPNTWLMERAVFQRIGGYDERFSGFYGSDGEFRDRVVRGTGEPIMLRYPVIRVGREVVPDASTTNYLRKQQMDREGVQKARALIAKDPTPHNLTFPWSEIDWAAQA